MIIGRTDENDIVINHRSISRNHAKLVREPETGRYTISDLQSSNGVRVNGQDYGKVELRRGDIVDLGHVRLRFVEPGEDFVFARDAVITDVPDAGGKKGLLVAIVLGVLVLGGVGAFVALRGGGDPRSRDRRRQRQRHERAAPAARTSIAGSGVEPPDGDRRSRTTRRSTPPPSRRRRSSIDAPPTEPGRDAERGRDRVPAATRPTKKWTRPRQLRRRGSSRVRRRRWRRSSSDRADQGGPSPRPRSSASVEARASGDKNARRRPRPSSIKIWQGSTLVPARARPGTTPPSSRRVAEGCIARLDAR